MTGAILIRWGAGIPGREAKGLEVFGKAIGYFEGLSKQGKIHGHKEFFSLTGPQSGFMVVDGEVSDLLQIVADEATLSLNSQAAAIVQDFEIQVFAGGSDASIQGLVGNYASSMQEIGYM